MNVHRDDPRPAAAAAPDLRTAPAVLEHRFHDVADLRTGFVETRPIVGTLSAATRANRLARLGFHMDSSIFANWAYRLTAKKPYQATPEAWLDVFESFTYSTGPNGGDQIWWRLPHDFQTEFMSGVNCNFATPPRKPLVVSLAIEAWPYQAATGVVVIEIGAQRVEIPIDAAGSRLVDIGMVQQNHDVFDARIFWRQGLYDFVFKAVTVRAGAIIVDPLAA